MANDTAFSPRLVRSHMLVDTISTSELQQAGTITALALSGDMVQWASDGQHVLVEGEPIVAGPVVFDGGLVYFVQHPLRNSAPLLHPVRKIGLERSGKRGGAAVRKGESGVREEDREKKCIDGVKYFISLSYD